MDYKLTIWPLIQQCRSRRTCGQYKILTVCSVSGKLCNMKNTVSQLSDRSHPQVHNPATNSAPSMLQRSSKKSVPAYRVSGKYKYIAQFSKALIGVNQKSTDQKFKIRQLIQQHRCHGVVVNKKV